MLNSWVYWMVLSLPWAHPVAWNSCNWGQAEVRAGDLHQYVYCGKADNWTEAEVRCKSSSDNPKETTLPRVYSKDDVKFIAGLVPEDQSPHSKSAFFLGLKKLKEFKAGVRLPTEWKWLIGAAAAEHWQNEAYHQPPTTLNPDEDYCAVTSEDNVWSVNSCNANWFLKEHTTHVVCSRRVPVELLNCSHAPCKNHGSKCQEVSPESNLHPGVNFNCQCGPHLTGPFCETFVNHCESAAHGQPCVQGFCQNGIQDYICNCNAGFTGRHCSRDIDECAELTPCRYGSTCLDHVNSYTCVCSGGYSGHDCSQEVDECASAPCVNGTCVDEVADYTCNCAHGFTGDNCEVRIPSTIPSTGTDTPKPAVHEELDRIKRDVNDGNEQLALKIHNVEENVQTTSDYSLLILVTLICCAGLYAFVKCAGRMRRQFPKSKRNVPTTTLEPPTPIHRPRERSISSSRNSSDWYESLPSRPASLHTQPNATPDSNYASLQHSSTTIRRQRAVSEAVYVGMPHRRSAGVSLSLSETDETMQHQSLPIEGSPREERWDDERHSQSLPLLLSDRRSWQRPPVVTSTGARRENSTNPPPDSPITSPGDLQSIYLT